MWGAFDTLSLLGNLGSSPVPHVTDNSISEPQIIVMAPVELQLEIK